MDKIFSKYFFGDNLYFLGPIGFARGTTAQFRPFPTKHGIRLLWVTRRMGPIQATMGNQEDGSTLGNQEGGFKNKKGAERSKNIKMSKVTKRCQKGKKCGAKK